MLWWYGHLIFYECSRAELHKLMVHGPPAVHKIISSGPPLFWKPRWLDPITLNACELILFFIHTGIYMWFSLRSLGIIYILQVTGV
jgi:hypothetical protein